MTAPALHSGESAARKQRRALGLDLAHPIADLLDIAEAGLHIPVLVDPFGDDVIAGVLLRNAESDCFVAINADFGAVRQRFTLAHELGHIHMGHQPRVDLAADVFGRGRNPQEVEANYFAAEFLAPRPAVMSWLEEHELVAAADQAATVVQLALVFGIAFSTTCFRLERTGAISSRAKDRLVGELSGGSSLSAELLQRYKGHRLTDSLEALADLGAYPRTPRQTAEYAERARTRGLLDDQEYRAIVPAPRELDLSDWVS
ncbi:MAG: ImmA/IrrE family metallo-endopeptidase [Solirubrobacteraceae bacterium]|jgi:Zn-dependent peptidase ImmA (M78 family)